MERAVTVVILSLVFLASQVSLRTLTTETGLCALAAAAEGPR